MSSLSERYQGIRDRIDEAARRAGRSADDVTLLAISKRHPDAAIQALSALGHRAFGENQVQAWRGRLTRFPKLEWHLVGALQTNKAPALNEGRPSLVHSVDRRRLVDALERRWHHLDPLDILVQVNIDRESQKAGCLPESLEGLVDHIAAQESLRLRGLMCIPRPSTEGAPRDAFARTRSLLEHIEDRIEGTPVLSMGMSGDFEAAIAEGSTLVRIGTALFGQRAP